MKVDRFLTGEVGHGAQNKPEDVFAVRHLVRLAGGGEIDESKDDPIEDGFFDTDLDEEINEFQEKNGLRVDGLITPGGETERNIVNQIVNDGRSADDLSDFSLNFSVGEGGTNDPADVGKTRRLLASAGELPFDHSSSDLKFIDSALVRSIRGHQENKNLFDDGLVEPGGPTFQSLQNTAADKKARQNSIEPNDPTRWLLSNVANGIPQKENENKGIQVAVRRGALKWLYETGGPAIKETLRRWGLIGPAIESQKQIEKTTNGSSERTDIPGPLPHVLPGGPKKPPEPDREEFPVDPPEPQTEIFPALEPVGPWVHTSPDQSDEIRLPNIFENRGGERVRVQNTDVREIIDECSKESTRLVEHRGGARKDDKEIKEVYLRNKLTGGRKGSSYLDVSFQDPVTKRFLHINTVDTKAKGTLPSLREERAAVNIMRNKEKGDVLVLVSKIKEGETFDKEKFKEFIMSIIEEVNQPFDENADEIEDRPRRVDPLKEP